MCYIQVKFTVEGKEFSGWYIFERLPQHLRLCSSAARGLGSLSVGAPCSSPS